MIRPWHTWTAFVLCIVVVLTAMGWISAKLIQLDRVQTSASLHAQHEETVQVAMWRLESMVGPMMVQEAARPYFIYNAFYPAGRAYTNMFAEVRKDAVLLPSPLLIGTPSHVLIHFQIEPDGEVTSPQVPTGNARDLAESKSHGGLTGEAIERSRERLNVLRPLLNRDRLLAACPISEPRTPGARGVVVPQPSRKISVQPEPMEQLLPQGDMMQQRAAIEQSSRVANMESNLQKLNYSNNALSNSGMFFRADSEIREGTMVPMWLGDVLIAARRVNIDSRDYIQGYQLNWPVLKQRLEGAVVDLFPAAQVKPARDNEPSVTRKLAALPVRLDTGAMPDVAVAISQPIRVTLIMAWACVALAAVAVGVLLSGTLTLSERRAAFVSAVSHELRTPLTTFKLYTDLLASGKVHDEIKRSHYVSVLSNEADRLSHLVENVLAYARLERNGVNRRVETIAMSDLLDRVRSRLADRAGQAQVTLSVEMGETLDGASVRADSAAVEQILFNLVDNACKYGKNDKMSTIRIEVEHDGKSGCIRVRDNGPGISRREARRLFKPFTKSADDAAHSAPGVGLGLTLSRRLARVMGGDLRVCPHTRGGACFILTLPTEPA